MSRALRAGWAARYGCSRLGSTLPRCCTQPPAGQDVPNRHYIDRWYYGRLVIVGYDRQRGSLCRLSKEDEATLTGKWMGVEAER